MKTIILNCTHRDNSPYRDEIIKPLICGKKLLKEKVSSKNYLFDDNGKNISAKNKEYAELTGLYWFWKNSKFKDYDYIGLCHYRRYFFPGRLSASDLIKKYGLRLIFLSKRLFGSRFAKRFTGGCFEYAWLENTHQFKKRYKKENLDRLLNSKYDLILPKKEGINDKNFFEQYSEKNELKILEKIILDISPEKIDAFNKVFSSDEAHLRNMFIMKKDLFNEYCDWLFRVLFELEKRCNGFGGKRSPAILSERLLDIFLYGKKLKSIEIPIAYIKQIQCGYN